MLSGLPAACRQYLSHTQAPVNPMSQAAETYGLAAGAPHANGLPTQSIAERAVYFNLERANSLAHGAATPVFATTEDRRYRIAAR
jgi:hypothetical protein